MSSRWGLDLFAYLLPTWLSIRDRPQPTSHERNVAFLEAVHLRHLTPVPSSFLPRCGLTPSFPPPPVHFSSHVFSDLANDDAEFFINTHLSFTEFTLLHTYLHSALLTSRNHSNNTSEHLHLMPTILTPADQLLLWLFHFSGDRSTQLALHFGHIHPTTVFRYIDHVSYCMNDALSTSISWPTAEERQLLHGRMSVCETAVAVLDGTHCAIEAPQQLYNSFFSGYKHKHTQNYLACVNYMGMIIHVDGPHPGRLNDREVYNNSDLCLNQGQYLSGDERILADGGFIGGGGLLVHMNTYNRAKDDNTKRVMMEYNKEFTANRLIVEDVFGWLKARAHVLNEVWTRDLDRQAEIFKAACKLHNFTRMIRIDYAVQLPEHNSNQPQ